MNGSFDGVTETRVAVEQRVDQLHGLRHHLLQYRHAFAGLAGDEESPLPLGDENIQAELAGTLDLLAELETSVRALTAA